MTKLPRLAVLSIVISGTDVLLVRRKNPPDAGLWGYPGGHVDLGERLCDAAIRELAEETGMRATAGPILPGLEVILHGDDGAVSHHFLLVPVICHATPGQVPIAGDDAVELRWWSHAQVLAGVSESSRDLDLVLRQALAALATA